MAKLVRLSCHVRLPDGDRLEEHSIVCAVSDSLREAALLTPADYEALCVIMEAFVPEDRFVKGTGKLASSALCGLDEGSDKQDVSSALELLVMDRNERPGRAAARRVLGAEDPVRDRGRSLDDSVGVDAVVSLFQSSDGLGEVTSLAPPVPVSVTPVLDMSSFTPVSVDDDTLTGDMFHNNNVVSLDDNIHVNCISSANSAAVVHDNLPLSESVPVSRPSVNVASSTKKISLRVDEHSMQLYNILNTAQRSDAAFHSALQMAVVDKSASFNCSTNKFLPCSTQFNYKFSSVQKIDTSYRAARRTCMMASGRLQYYYTLNGPLYCRSGLQDQLISKRDDLVLGTDFVKHSSQRLAFDYIIRSALSPMEKARINESYVPCSSRIAEGWFYGMQRYAVLLFFDSGDNSNQALPLLRGPVVVNERLQTPESLNEMPTSMVYSFFVHSVMEFVCFAVEVLCVDEQDLCGSLDHFSSASGLLGPAVILAAAQRRVQHTFRVALFALEFVGLREAYRQLTQRLQRLLVFVHHRATLQPRQRLRDLLRLRDGLQRRVVLVSRLCVLHPARG